MHSIYFCAFRAKKRIITSLKVFLRVFSLRSNDVLTMDLWQCQMGVMGERGGVDCVLVALS